MGGKGSGRFPHDEKRAEEIVKRHEAGETYQAIGESYGITRQRIYRIIKDYKETLNGAAASI